MPLFDASDGLFSSLPSIQTLQNAAALFRWVCGTETRSLARLVAVRNRLRDFQPLLFGADQDPTLDNPDLLCETCVAVLVNPGRVNPTQAEAIVRLARTQWMDSVTESAIYELVPVWLRRRLAFDRFYDVILSRMTVALKAGSLAGSRRMGQFVDFRNALQGHAAQAIKDRTLEVISDKRRAHRTKPRDNREFHALMMEQAQDVFKMHRVEAASLLPKTYTTCHRLAERIVKWERLTRLPLEVDALVELVTGEFRDNIMTRIQDHLTGLR